LAARSGLVTPGGPEPSPGSDAALEVVMSKTIPEEISALAGARRTRKFVQARGEARRRQLLDTALSLLRTKTLDEITYQEVSQAAGIPLASCYHFYANKIDLFAALIDFNGQWFYQTVKAALRQPAETWQDLVVRLADALAAEYNRDLAFAQLFSSWKIPRSAYPKHDEAHHETAAWVLKEINRRFLVTRFPDDVRVVGFALRMAGAAFTSSLQMHGRVEPFYQAEAVRAVVAYLSNYYAPITPRRTIEHPLAP